MVAKVRDGEGGFGYSAQTDTYEDLVKAGVIDDPTKVVRGALQNAASIASLLLTTEAVVVGRGAPGGREVGHAWRGWRRRHGRAASPKFGTESGRLSRLTCCSRKT